MAISHKEILEEMTPEQRARVEARAKELIEEKLARRGLCDVDHHPSLLSLQQQAKQSGKNLLPQNASEAEIAAARKERRIITE